MDGQKSSSSTHLHSAKQTVLKEHPACCCKVKVKGKAVPVHTMQAYSRSRGITTNIHNNDNVSGYLHNLANLPTRGNPGTH
jgi:hypothetical protein